VAKRPIALLGEEVLRRPAAEVGEIDDEVRALVRDMFDTMYDAEGIGLAAPQVGISRRIIVVDVNDDDHEPMALIDPRVVEEDSSRERAEEGCLSMPGLAAVVERPAKVVVEALTMEGETVRLEGEGLYGRCLQHEIDHLDGVLFLDRISPLKRRMLLRQWKKRKK
jgi:peptide deformylase